MTNLHCIIYTSRAAAPLQADDIAFIDYEACKNNILHDITGRLIYHEGRFLQYIEGPQAEIDQLYANICADDRHDEVKLAHSSPLPHRLFGDWGMQLMAEDALREAVADHGDFLAAPRPLKALVGALETIKALPRAHL